MTSDFTTIRAALRDEEPGFSPRESQQMLNAGQTVSGANPDAPAVKLNIPDHSNAELFMASTLSSMTKEMFGSRPGREIEKFRTENPIAGGISWMLGATPFFMMPQMGAVKAASAVLPGFTKAMSLAEKLKSSGNYFRSGALAEATRFAPLETGRIAGSLFNPEEGSTPRTLASTTSELGFLGILGGAGSMMSARMKNLGFERLRAADDRMDAVREKAVSDHIGKGFDRTGPVQDKWETLNLWKNKKEFEQLPIRLEIEELLARYESRIKNMEPPEVTKTTNRVTDPKTGKETADTVTARTRYVANMGSSAATKRVESLYEFGTATGRGAKGIMSKIMRLDAAPGMGGFFGDKATEALKASQAGWQAIVEKSGVAKGWQAITQFPRELQSGSVKSQERLMEILNKDFQQLSDDSWLAREAAEGLSIGVKRLPGKGRRSPDGKFEMDRFYIFKTNKPSKWFKESSEIHDTNARTFLEDLPGWNMVEKVPDKAVPTLATTRNTWAMQNPANASLFSGNTRFSSNPNTSAEASQLRIFWDRMFPQSVVEATSPFFDAANKIGQRSKHFIASQRLQAANNPRLQNIIMSTGKIFEAQAARASDIILGPIADDFIREGTMTPIRSIFSNALKPDQRRVGGTQQLFRKYLDSEGSLKDFNAMRIAGMSADDAGKVGLHPNAVQLARELEVVDKMITDEIAAQARALGMENSFVPRKGHFAIANTWVGPFRVALKDAQSTDIVGFASGFSREQAGNEAIRLTEIINAEARAAGKPKQLQTYSDFEGKSADLILNDSIVHAGSEQAFKDMVGLRALNKHLGLEAASADASARQADIFGFATQINLSNPLVESLKKARTNMYSAEPGRFAKSKGFLGARGTENVPFTLSELETTHSAGIVESLRYLAREAVAHGPMSEQIKLLAKENAGDAVTFNRIFNSMNGVSGPVSRTIERGVDAVRLMWLGLVRRLRWSGQLMKLCSC